MKRQKPAAGEFYRHFKGELYQIKMLARDSSSLKEMVVYQAMYAPYAYWVRDLEEFISEVDKEKYPDAKQYYRFEKVAFEISENGSPVKPSSEKEEVQENVRTETADVNISDEMLKKALKSGQPQRYLDERITEEEIAQRGLLQLLDAEGFREKRQIFIGLKPYLNARMLNNIAVALDIVLEDGDLETQYESIMRCMEAFEHYEGRRLR
ncbi:MAG TPA: hypothetical protein DDY31_19240 [Lachnospiraceae bacterium]|nr:hypothetical protein [Lachnospiraceae bacterium]